MSTHFFSIQFSLIFPSLYWFGCFLWWPPYVWAMCELWSSLFLFVRIVTKIKEVSEDDSWWFHLISVAPFFDHIWKAGPHLICTTAPPLVIILCLIMLSLSSESWFKDFFFWGTSALFLIYDRYIWKGRIIFPSFLFSTSVNFLEDVHLQDGFGYLWNFVKGYHLKLGYIEKSLEAVHCTITFCNALLLSIF